MCLFFHWRWAFMLFPGLGHYIQSCKEHSCPCYLVHMCRYICSVSSQAVELPDPRVFVFLAFLVTVEEFSNVVLPIYPLTKGVRVPVTFYPCQRGILSLFNFSYTDVSLVIPYLGLNLHFLMTNNVEHLFIY